MSTKNKSFTTAELRALADEFLAALDTEEHDECKSQRAMAGEPLKHFVKWLGNRKHHYQCDGYLMSL